MAEVLPDIKYPDEYLIFGRIISNRFELIFEEQKPDANDEFYLWTTYEKIEFTEFENEGGRYPALFVQYRNWPEANVEFTTIRCYSLDSDMVDSYLSGSEVLLDLNFGLRGADFYLSPTINGVTILESSPIQNDGRLSPVKLSQSLYLFSDSISNQLVLVKMETSEEDYDYWPDEPIFNWGQ